MVCQYFNNSCITLLGFSVMWTWFWIKKNFLMNITKIMCNQNRFPTIYYIQNSNVYSNHIYDIIFLRKIIKDLYFVRNVNIV